MQQAQVLKTSVNLVIYKPVVVMLCQFIGIPHGAIVAASIALLLTVILLIGRVNKRFTWLICLPVGIIALLELASFNRNEYIYNAMFAANIFLIIALFCLQKNRRDNHSDLLWHLAIIATLAASYIDALFFKVFTNFEGRNTLIGYENPLWAARDLAIIVFYFLLTSRKNRVIEIVVFLATMLFFLEARAMFLISIFVYLFKFRLIYLAVGGVSIVGIFYLLIDLNPYSVSKRLTEWQNIVFNLDQVPVFGFGVKNYANISFTNLGAYPHNWILDVILGYGIIGVFFTIWVGFNLIKLFQLKDRNQLHYLMAIPIIYVLAGLSQGSLISGMLGLSLIPIGFKMNSLLMSKNFRETPAAA